MKEKIAVLCCVVLWAGCAFVNHKMEIKNALVDRPDLSGLTEERITQRFGLPENIIPVKSGHRQDETWVYRDKWYGLMSVRIIDGQVSDVSYQYGMLSR